MTAKNNDTILHIIHKSITDAATTIKQSIENFTNDLEDIVTEHLPCLFEDEEQIKGHRHDRGTNSNSDEEDIYSSSGEEISEELDIIVKKIQ
jgi:hypothetical protein